MSSPPAQTDEAARVAAASKSRRRAMRFLIVPVVLVSLVATRLLFGPTSHASPTGSLAGVVSTVAEQWRLDGIDPSKLTISAAISRADNHWAKFVVAPTPGSSSSSTYGFVRFQNRGWVVITDGVANVGCTAGSLAVPARVLRGFGLNCP